MLRRIVNLCGLISLLLCAAICVLWFRSLSFGDSAVFCAKSGNGYFFKSVPHGVSIGFHEGYADLMSWIEPPRPGWSWESHAWDNSRTVSAKSNAGDVRIHDAYVVISYPRPLFARRSLGFSFERSAFPKPPPPSQRINAYLNYVAPTTQPMLRGWSLVIPSWFLVAVLLSPSLIKLVRAIRRSTRRTANQCIRCGYDLRATPDRCPECGTIAEKVSAE